MRRDAGTGLIRQRVSVAGLSAVNAWAEAAGARKCAATSGSEFSDPRGTDASRMVWAFVARQYKLLPSH